MRLLEHMRDEKKRHAVGHYPLVLKACLDSILDYCNEDLAHLHGAKFRRMPASSITNDQVVQEDALKRGVHAEVHNANRSASAAFQFVVLKLVYISLCI